MKKRNILICLTAVLSLFLSCKNEKKQSAIEDTEDIVVYDFNGLEPLLHTKSDKTYLINFMREVVKILSILYFYIFIYNIGIKLSR